MAALLLPACFASGLYAAELGRFAIVRTPPADCASSIQNPPAHVTSLSTTDSQVYLWFYVTNARRGEVAASQYITPAGQTYAENSGAWPANDGDGTYCFLDSPLRIAGAPPAQMTGTWTVRVTYQGVLLFSTTFTITAPGGSGGGSTPAGANLIRNPGAEENTVTGCANAAITGWTKSGNLSVCTYGGDVAVSDPGPPDRGKNHFSGGPDNASSSITQTIDISGQAAAIDAGTLPYTLSGYVGGWDGQDDNAVLKANFKSAAGATLASAQVGPVLSAERKGATGMWLRSASGRVPAGARSVEVVLLMTRTSGAWNDGIADNLSLVLGGSGGGASACTYALESASASMPASGGNGTVRITAGTGCSWTATSNASWITLTGSASGAGSGSVSFTVAANTGAARTGTITAAGQTYTVTQAAGVVVCSYSISPSVLQAPAGGTSGTVRVSAAGGCSWTASSNASWISVTAGSSGSGEGTVSYTVAANTSTSSRTGTVTIAGQTFTVAQAGAPACSFSISPSSAQAPAGGNTGSVQVATASGCSWTASSNVSWITISSGRSGTGNGTVQYTVAANTSTSSRSGTLTVAGLTFTLTQAGAPACNYTISPTRASFTGAGGAGGVVVTTTSACSWTATSGFAWIAVTSGGSGTGNGTVNYKVEANPSETAREGMLSIAGQAFVINQAGTVKDLPTVARVVNAASYLPADLQGGGVAQGALFTLLGKNLGPDPAVSASAWPIEVKLADVSVRVVKGSTQVDAFPVLVSATRIDAVLPSGVPLGEAQVTVTVAGKTSAPARMLVVANGFGIFGANNGRGPGRLFHVSDAGQTPVTSASPARPGEKIALHGTGLGAIGYADNQAPPAGELGAPVEVLVSHRQARKLSSGRATNVAPGTAGVDEIVFEVPGETPAGCFVPVQVRTGDTVYSNVVTMAVEPEGKPCSDPLNPFAEINTKGRKGGSVFLVRAPVAAVLEPDKPATEMMLDLAIGVFQESAPGGEQGFNPLFALPPVGACTNYTGEVDAGSLLGDPAGATSGGGEVLGRELDAGAVLTLKGPKGERQLVHSDAEKGTGPYMGLLGGVVPLEPDDEPPPPPFLDGGSYTLSGPGGKDVGAFNATLDVPPPLDWTNRGKLTQVDRAAGLEFTWTGGSPNTLVLLGGVSTDQKSKSSGGFFCFVPSEPGAFTVPAPVLSNMPATSTLSLEDSMGAVIFGSVPLNFARFSAPGLDSGLLFSGVLNVVTVPVK
ncbi:MAG: BACON domain-containing protein [Bryobacteraceae bacterium]